MHTACWPHRSHRKTAVFSQPPTQHNDEMAVLTIITATITIDAHQPVAPLLWPCMQVLPTCIAIANAELIMHHCVTSTLHPHAHPHAHSQWMQDRRDGACVQSQQHTLRRAAEAHQRKIEGVALRGMACVCAWRCVAGPLTGIRDATASEISAKTYSDLVDLALRMSCTSLHLIGPTPLEGEADAAPPSCAIAVPPPIQPPPRAMQPGEQLNLLIRLIESSRIRTNCHLFSSIPKVTERFHTVSRTTSDQVRCRSPPRWRPLILWGLRSTWRWPSTGVITTPG
jgi:hypothetical protein